MLVKYQRNGRFTCYDSESLTSGSKPSPQPYLVGPFKNCIDCPLASTSQTPYGFKRQIPSNNALKCS